MHKHERLRKIIKQGGGTFHALQVVPAVPAYRCWVGRRWITKSAMKKYSLVYFHSPKHGSTLAMKVCGLTPEKVRQHIEESNRRMGAA